ncbi:hypothetical protein [Methanothermococcus okinawensis]|uniref:Uncharacterized protein n=1 Tax=Methanothermococcus okinawensis (strain DSM 14208 / JCM 11175 / IH1) TaxID=647113 RepID=F8AM57_METOI|nr:hypothetical protein [Methanothermococcus okinawensis]AEH06742.1 hypothetical protein Metok_0765 [Methanothermococcus okinawensis IH1]
MDIKEILELVEEGYTSENTTYKNKVYAISYFLSALIFILIHIAINYNSPNILFVISFLMLVGGILIIKQKIIYKKFKCYFDKIFEKIMIYGLFAIILSSIISLYVFPEISCVFISLILGFLICIDGALFNSKGRKILGVIVMLSSIPIIMYIQYQFLILAFVQFLVSFYFLIRSIKCGSNE